MIGIGLLFLAAACSDSPKVTTQPTPVPSPTSTPVSNTVAVTITGQVVDFDSGEPIVGETVRTSYLLVQTGAFLYDRVAVPGPGSAVTDANGSFTMSAVFPVAYRYAALALSRPGYDARNDFTLKSLAGDVLRLEPILTIQAGQTIEALGYSERPAQCGWNEDISCRRLVVVAAPGELVDLEAISTQSGDRWGLTYGNFTHQPDSPPSRLTVPAGDVYILPLSRFGRVIITARKH